LKRLQDQHVERALEKHGLFGERRFLLHGTRQSCTMAGHRLSST
jgi:hypothetical protein